MTDQNLTHLYFLLDRSGSMSSIADDVAGGFDAFIAEQRAGDGTCRVTLAQFDDSYEEVYADRPVADVPPLALQPRGTTALLDSLGRLVTEAGARLAALPEDRRPDTVVVGVMTDGLENASREWTHQQVKALLDQQSRDYGWEFLYLGADQDAVEVGMSMGFSADKSMTYGRGKSREAMGAMSSVVRSHRDVKMTGAPAAPVAFTEKQRRDSRD